MIAERQFRRVASGLLNARCGFFGISRRKREFFDLLSVSREQLSGHSLAKLKRVLCHAYSTTAYYQRVFDSLRFNPQHVNSARDISVFPLLDQQVIENNRADLTSTAYAEESLIRSYTGGTTGTHRSFYRDRECHVTRIARQQGIQELCGYHPGDRCGLIWGAHADIEDWTLRLNLKKQFRRFASGQETLPCRVLTEEMLDRFYRRLVRFKPKVLYGYPNAMSHFAEFVETSRVPPIHVETIICTAERLTEKQRQQLTRVFRGDVFNIYGSREHGFMAFECGKHSGFHVDVGSVLLEVVENGQPVRPGELGDLVITDLCNFGMPFIRHRIGDRGRLCPEPCNCGLPLPLLKSLDGRVTDAVYRPDGTRVDGCLLADLFLDVKPIRAMQIVQETIGRIDLNLVVTADYGEGMEKQVLQEIRECMGADSTICIHIVPDIPRSPNSGKFQEVICRIPPPSLPV